MHNILTSVTWVANYYSFYHTKLHFVCCIIIRLLRCILTFSSHLLVALVWTTAGHHLHHILNCHVAYSQCRCQSLFQADHNSQWGPLHNDHKLHQIPGTVSHPNSQSVSQSLKSEWLSPLEPQKQKKSGRVVSWLQDESLVGSPALLVPHSSPCRRRRRSQVTI